MGQPAKKFVAPVVLTIARNDGAKPNIRSPSRWHPTPMQRQIGALPFTSLLAVPTSANHWTYNTN